MTITEFHYFIFTKKCNYKLFRGCLHEKETPQNCFFLFSHGGFLQSFRVLSCFSLLKFVQVWDLVLDGLDST